MHGNTDNRGSSRHMEGWWSWKDDLLGLHWPFKTLGKCGGTLKNEKRKEFHFGTKNSLSYIKQKLNIQFGSSSGMAQLISSPAQSQAGGNTTYT